MRLARNTCFRFGYRARAARTICPICCSKWTASVVLAVFAQVLTEMSHNGANPDPSGYGLASFNQIACTCFSVRHGFDVVPHPGATPGAVVAVASTSSRTRSYWFCVSVDVYGGMRHVSAGESTGSA